MNLTDEQKRAVAGWIRNRAGLAEVQTRLRDEFGISLTYMEARLLMGDLNLTPKETRESTAPKPGISPSTEGKRVPDVPSAIPETSAPSPGGKVRVTLDQLSKPNAIISGKVTFSDGATAEWYLDNLGRLGLNSTKPGYRPSQQDVVAFQTELQRLARAQGY